MKYHENSEWESVFDSTLLVSLSQTTVIRSYANWMIGDKTCRRLQGIGRTYKKWISETISLDKTKSSPDDGTEEIPIKYSSCSTLLNCTTRNFTEKPLLIEIMQSG